MNPLHALLLTDLAMELPMAVRLQRLVELLRMQFGCGAVALLSLDSETSSLRPVAVDGLSSDAVGRRFPIAEHPRLATLLKRAGEVVRFPHDSKLPDPYDGLVIEQPGQPLDVHDCMGVALEVEGQCWGVLTLDALTVGTFEGKAIRELEQLVLVIEAAVRVTRLETALRGVRQSAGAVEEGVALRPEGEIIGQSKPLLHLLQELQVVADTELPVLLLGETGVGKELFARRLHQMSRRSGKPLVHVNCAALPEALAESELFGHVRGAFSGAIAERAGRFEAAEGGTLFLDEVGELPLSIQAKLLRALQNGEIQRLGADRPRKVNVRIIAATNRNLKERVQEGSFRADLYHRLSVYPVPIPPLRERGNDVLLLAGFFLELNRARLGLRSLRLSVAAEDALHRYAWPGNVRELEHVVSRAALKALSHGAQRSEIVTLEADWLGLEVQPQPSVATVLHAPMLAPAPSMRAVVDSAQREAIRWALDAHRGQWAQAARSLDVDPSNLHKLAKRLGLKAA
ncbi:nitric oxide reductase transcriptional regulator NorR [Comamonas jiangduensis]|uniref:nitric oxide reductase transcriptional regulator NorR n=1 Tax=Comamonas jiangduensis TaxID=1194168 RepID=UPI0028AB56E4|nr:nitric oxide reductase transcriptional regulator NorR [Comamonas jiangduensis]